MGQRNSRRSALSLLAAAAAAILMPLTAGASASPTAVTPPAGTLADEAPSATPAPKTIDAETPLPTAPERTPNLPANTGRVAVVESPLPGQENHGLVEVHREDANSSAVISLSQPDGQFAQAPVKMGTALTVNTGHPSTTVFGNLTVVAANTKGFTTAWPCDAARPVASTNNFTAGTWALPNFVAVKTDPDGNACFYTSGDAELLWDQYGPARQVTSSIPLRKFDTRHGGSKISSHGVHVYSTGTPGATLMGNVTVTGTAASGFTTVYPCNEGRPRASTNNFTAANQTVPNFAVVKADSNGEVCFYSTTATHMLFDEVAMVAPQVLQAKSPERLLDTRQGGAPPIRAGNLVTVETGLPNTTVLGNLTVTGPAGRGYTTLWDCSSERPTASTNNYAWNQTIANFAAVRTNSEGKFCIFTSAPAHLVWDTSAVTSTFKVGNPNRLLDTRQWGGGAAGGDDDHWSLLATLGDAPAKWDECTPEIPVLVNPDNGGHTQLPAIRYALDNVRKATGLPLAYAGSTSTVPTLDNNFGYDMHMGQPAMVVAFVDPDTNPVVPAYVGGIGGMYFYYADPRRPRASYGFALINADVLGHYPEDVLTSLYMHEIGHAVGLGHYEDERQVMNPILHNVSTHWGRGDLHGLAFIGRATGAGCPIG